jgi:TolB protein
MMKTALLVILALLLCGSLVAQQATPSPIPDEKHLKHARQLTFGGQNAEAYFSPNGQRIIFQSTRDGLQCDQIFMMNADGSDVRMVSTGKGRTTCAWFMPDGERFIYASTHEAGAACPTMPEGSMGRGGYAWSVFPSFKVYLADPNGKILRKLTDSPGYDAEATMNWKTGKIIWTAHRDGDIDLYSMNSDGTGVKRLTNKAGYDGGANYSNDGKKIVWRAHYPKTEAELRDYKEKLANAQVTPMKMELQIADADGKNQRQLTSFGCASFAPIFTPDDRKILFASNKNDCDSRNFDLFLINPDGSGLEQVTHLSGFTSFPMISPDGKKIVFVSDRGAKSAHEFNIFIADWNN